MGTLLVPGISKASEIEQEKKPEKFVHEIRIDLEKLIGKSQEQEQEIFQSLKEEIGFEELIPSARKKAIDSLQYIANFIKTPDNKKFLIYLQEMMDIDTIKPHPTYENFDYLRTLVEKDGHKFLEYARKIGGVKDFKDINLIEFSSLLKERGYEKAVELNNKGLDEVYNIHDYLHFCKKADKIDKLKLELFKKYGIAYFGLCREEILKGMLEPAKKPVMLMIMGKKDLCWYMEEYGYSQGLIFRKNIENLSKEYHIIMYQVNYEDQAYKAIRDTGEKYTSFKIYFKGHGTSFSINLGDYDADNEEDLEEKSIAYLDKELEKRYIDLTDEKELTGLTNSSIEKLILDSCSNGKGREKQKNMANMFKRIFPKADVYSSTIGTSGMACIFDKNDNLIEAIPREGRSFLYCPK